MESVENIELLVDFVVLFVVHFLVGILDLLVGGEVVVVDLSEEFRLPFMRIVLD